MPVVSIILPTRDRPHLLPRAVASILRQTWTDFEVILIDANRRSPPVGSDPIMAGLLQDARIRLIVDGTSVNSAQSRNRGLDAAHGDWITYLDDDDAYAPGKLAAQLQTMLAESAKLVLCGYRVHLKWRERVRQTAVTGYRGDDLLLAATWATPMIFHRNDGVTRFDETLRAGEDANFAHRFVLRHGIEHVPNAAQPLVEVYPQAGIRVHADFEAVWSSCQQTAGLVRGRYSAEALEAYLARAEMLRAQGGHGSWMRFLRLAAAVGLGNPRKNWRLVLNALAYRTRVLRPFIVR